MMSMSPPTIPAPPPDDTRPDNERPSGAMPVVDPVPFPAGADPHLRELVTELRAARRATAETYAVASETLSVLRDVQGGMARLETLARVQDQHGHQLQEHDTEITRLERRVAHLEAELEEVKGSLEEVRARG